MTDKNKHIEDYLDKYREMEEVDFAVLITGAWGCGKKRFIEQYLNNHYMTKDNKGFTYANLNVIDSLTDMIQLLGVSEVIKGKILAFEELRQLKQTIIKEHRN